MNKQIRSWTSLTNAAKVAQLRDGEDHDVTNQYTAMGSIKPGRFRLWTEIVILYGVNWVARHIFTRGSIGRIGTIHFAHWVFLDERRRGFFCSNYDGGHEAYMDDFINKAGFGLNLAFSSYHGLSDRPIGWSPKAPGSNRNSSDFSGITRFRPMSGTRLIRD